MAISRRDIDQIFTAIRPRLGQRSGSTGGSVTLTIPPHAHSADQISLIPCGDVESANVQDAICEIAEDKLARDGHQAMLGSLDLDTWSIYNVFDLEVLNDASVGQDLLVIRNAHVVGTMTVDVDVSVGRNQHFTGPIGQAILDGVRQIQMVGDHADDEAKIYDLERLVFNNEPSASSIETLSRIEWNTGVAPGSDFSPIDGVLGWSTDEGALTTWSQSGGGGSLAEVAHGWAALRCYSGGGFVNEGNPDGDMPKGSVVVMAEVAGSGIRPGVVLYTGGVQTPGLEQAHQVLGVTMTDSAEDDQVEVMHRGILRDCDSLENWSAGDVLWAKDNGTMTNVRPVAPDALVVVGFVLGQFTEGGPYDVVIDVRPVPPPSELSNVLAESVENFDALLYDLDAQVWRMRPIHGSRSTDASGNAGPLDHLVRVDATSGPVTITLPEAAVSANLVLHVKKTDASANRVTIDGYGTDLVEDEETFDLILQGESLMLQCDGVSWAVI